MITPAPNCSKVVALHGVESVGKSTLAASLAERLGCEWVPEYGRLYCEVNGTDLSASDLERIAAEQQAQIAAAQTRSDAAVITDTDWLMTEAWSEMLFDEPLRGLSYRIADLYLHLPPDLAFVQDSVRMFGEDGDRQRFDQICRKVLAKADANWIELDAPIDKRFDQALKAIAEL
ncbi:MAG: AAA family ATPase [Pseudomonadota bacterium]